jgi:4-hydroxy-3-methylbut-2-enyl diphosphate reductase
MMKLILAQPQGFCAGVKRAIEIVERALEVYGPPIYVRHEIVHNKYVIENLQRKGVIFVNKTHEIPKNANAIFSAHGVSLNVEQEAIEQNLNIIDATCPLVTKVHLEAIKNENEGKQILMIGHKNHPEVIGTIGRISQAVQVIETVEDIDSLHIIDPDKLRYVTQTTLSIDDTSEIIEKLKTLFPNITGPGLKDICYATQNRQDAVKSLVPHIDIMLVVGSLNSSNSNRLKDLSENMKIPSYLIDDQDQIDLLWFKNKTNIGMTSGASAPEELVNKIIDFLRSSLPISHIETFPGKIENLTFKLPAKLLMNKTA